MCQGCCARGSRKFGYMKVTCFVSKLSRFCLACADFGMGSSPSRGDLSDVSPLVRITTPKKQEVINSSQSQKRSVAWKHVLLLEDAQNTRIIESTEDLEGFELLRPEDRT